MSLNSRLALDAINHEPEYAMQVKLLLSVVRSTGADTLSQQQKCLEAIKQIEIFVKSILDNVSVC